jgi:hypothetical protein
MRCRTGRNRFEHRGQIVAVRRGGSAASLKAKITENAEAAIERLGVADKVIRQCDVGKSK